MLNETKRFNSELKEELNRINSNPELDCSREQLEERLNSKIKVR